MGAVDGDDRGDLEAGHAEDLVGLIGLPADPIERQAEWVAAVPQQPIRAWNRPMPRVTTPTANNSAAK
jgi:hypothetical protein